MKKTLVSMIKGTLVLTIAGIIARVLGFFFKQYLAGQIGAEGIGLIQLTMPLWGLIQAVYSGGLTSTVSSMVATSSSQDRNVTAKALLLGFGTGVMVAVPMIMGAFYISDLLGDDRLCKSVQIMAISVPIIGMASAIKGYFLGKEQRKVPAVAQILEQAVRIGSSYLMVVFLWDGVLANAVSLCTLGTTCGEIGSLLVVAVPYALKGRQRNRNKTTGIGKELVQRSIPPSVGKLASSFLTVVETALVPVALSRGDMSFEQGISVLGLVEGISIPLIMLPGMFCTSLSSVAVPAISSAARDKGARQERVEICLKISIILGFVMAGIFQGYWDLVAYVTYPASDVGEIIRGVAPCCIFAYPILTMTGIMQALRLQKPQLANTVLGYVLRIMLHWVLSGQFGVRGYMASLLISYAVICCLNILKVMAYTNLRVKLFSWCWQPALCYLLLIVTAQRLSGIIWDITSGSRLAILALVGGVGICALILASLGLTDRLIPRRTEGIESSGQITPGYFQ